MMKYFWQPLLASSMLMVYPLTALTTGSLPTTPSSSSVPGSTSSTPSAPKPPAQEQTPFVPLPKTALPSTMKPFGMPGIVGLQNGKWAGTDYLGYVSNHIALDIEVLKGQNVPEITDTALLVSRVRTILAKEDIVPDTDVIEGPPLPFLHILLIIYPAEKDRFVIFGASRLFEQIQVMRKNFRPAGYWQGITWENQDVRLATADQLNAQVMALVDGLAFAFAKRYKEYNPIPGHPGETTPVQPAGGMTLPSTPPTSAPLR